MSDLKKAHKCISEYHKSKINKNVMLECYNLLQLIKVRPAMYVGEVSLKSIHIYISGYYLALFDNKLIQENEEELSFHDWVANKLQYCESTAGWANMILAHTLGFNPKEINWEEFLKVEISKEQHLESVNNFYILIEQFKKKIELNRL